MIFVGCPVYDRDWILPRWFEHVEQALDGEEYGFAFVLDSGDESTLALIDAHACMVGRPYEIAYALDEGLPGHRNWNNPKRLEYMSDLRNALLSLVRREDPDYFLSLDSDILITKESFDLVKAAVVSGQFDAVAGKTFLGKGRGITNAASYARASGLKRSQAEYLTHADIIMAYKLMNRKAYSIDYKFNNLGEDIGWSLNCRAEGVKLGFEGTVAVKHVMESCNLDQIDKRVGY
jgi:hypothetical protein